MVDQVYYKVQYPLKKAIDLMKNIDEKNINLLKNGLNQYEKEKIIKFINSWDNSGKNKLELLINDLKEKQ